MSIDNLKAIIFFKCFFSRAYVSRSLHFYFRKTLFFLDLLYILLSKNILKI